MTLYGATGSQRPLRDMIVRRKGPSSGQYSIREFERNMNISHHLQLRGPLSLDQHLGRALSRPRMIFFSG